MKRALAAAALLLAAGGFWIVRAQDRALPVAAMPPTTAAQETRPQVAAAAQPVPPKPPGLAFVINSGQASIDLIEIATHRTLRTIPVLREPHHMALTPDHRSLIVGDTGANELLFLDPASGELQRRMTVSDPYQFGFSPDGRWFVVNGLARNQIDIYDAATMRLAHRLPVSAMPSHLNFSPDSQVVYVSLQSTNSLVAIRVATGEVLWKSVVGPTPAGVLWHRGRILVGVMGADYVAVVDPADGHVERRVHTAKGAHVLFVPHDGKVIYVTDRVDGNVVVLDPATLAEIRRFRIPGGPDDMDFAPDGKIWVTRRFDRSVAIVDPQTGAFETIPAGRSPHGIWLNTHDTLAPPLKLSAR